MSYSSQIRCCLESFELASASAILRCLFGHIRLERDAFQLLTLSERTRVYDGDAARDRDLLYSALGEALLSNFLQSAPELECYAF